MNNWKCYILKSIYSRRTYVGATIDVIRRLNDHNGINKGKGARATRGRWWEVSIIVTGFVSKNSCLAFESAVRRIRRSKYNGLPYVDLAPISKRVVDIFNTINKGHKVHEWKNLNFHFIENVSKEAINTLESMHKNDILCITDKTCLNYFKDIDHL